MYLNFNFQEADASALLEITTIKKQIFKRIALHISIATFLLTIFTIKNFTNNNEINNVINVIIILFLIGLPLFTMLKSLREKKFLPIAYGGSIRQEELYFNQKALHIDAVSTILPTIYSTYHNLSTIKQIITYFSFTILIIFLYNVISADTAFWITFTLYTFMIIRYVRCLRQLQQCIISISHETLIVPVLGFFKLYYRQIPFKDIKNNITPVQVIDVKPDIFERDKIDIDEHANYFKKNFMQGIRIYYNQSKITLSTATVSFDFLQQLLQIFKQNKIAITKRSLHK